MGEKLRNQRNIERLGPGENREFSLINQRPARGKGKENEGGNNCLEQEG